MMFEIVASISLAESMMLTDVRFFGPYFFIIGLLLKSKEFKVDPIHGLLMNYQPYHFLRKMCDQLLDRL